LLVALDTCVRVTGGISRFQLLLKTLLSGNISARILTIIHIVIWYTPVELARQPILLIGIFSYPGEAPELQTGRIGGGKRYLAQQGIVVNGIGCNRYTQHLLPHRNHGLYFLVKAAYACCIGQFDWWKLRNARPAFLLHALL